MADRGRELTDEYLANLEKRIKGEYRQASKEVQRKLNDYLTSVAEQTEKQKALVAAGKMSEKEFRQWEVRKLAMGKRWEELRDNLAQDYVNADKIARNMVTDSKPDVYALNHNYMTYQIEHDAKVDTSYTLYDRATVERLMADDPDILPEPGKKVSKLIAEGKAERWNKQQIQSVMMQSILQGEKINEIAHRLATAVGDSDAKAAIRNARTMTTNAESAGRYDGMRRAKNMGIDCLVEWVATLDERTRTEHRYLHGQRQEIDTPFEVSGVRIMYPADLGGKDYKVPPNMIWNCFVGETIPDTDSEIQKSYKHMYSGTLIKIKTACGLDFTCTPNHPILTPTGWITAERFNNGDDILVTFRGNEFSSTGKIDVNQAHTSMETLHNSFKKLGTVERINMSYFDFHGDIPTSDIEVVTKKWKLRRNRNTNFCKFGNKFLFKYPNALILGARHLVKRFFAVFITTFSFMSRRSKPLSFFRRSISHSDIHRFRTTTNRNIALPEYSINNLPTDTVIRSELFNGIPGKVFIDKIISVNRFNASCHVYNLQTEKGYYYVKNSISQNCGKGNDNICAIVKNCRCSIICQIKGFETETIKYSPKMGQMTYEEWLKEKPVYGEAGRKKSFENARNAKPIQKPQRQAQPKATAPTDVHVSNVISKSMDNPQEYKDVLLKSDASVRIAYEKYSDDVRKCERKAHAGQYSAATKTIYWDYETNYPGEISKYSTLAHEYGHHVDNMVPADAFGSKEIDLLNDRVQFGTNYKVFKKAASSSDEFLEGMRADREFNKGYLSDAIRRAEIHSDLQASAASAGVQDAFDGWWSTQDSKDRSFRLNWGHGDRYYNREYNRKIKDLGLEKDVKAAFQELGFDASSQAKVKRITRDYETASELWANITSAKTVGGSELEYMQKYCPNAVKAWETIMGRIK